MGFGRKWKNWGGFAAAEVLEWHEEGGSVPSDVPEEAGSQRYALESDLIETLQPFGWPYDVTGAVEMVGVEEAEEGWAVPIFRVKVEIRRGDRSEILAALKAVGYTPHNFQGFGWDWDQDGRKVTGSKVISTTKLSKMLYGAGLWPRTFTVKDLKKRTPAARGVGNETYGKKSMLYLRARDMEHRNAIERFLDRNNIKAFMDYSPGSPVVEVQVSYFKGWHWDE